MEKSKYLKNPKEYLVDKGVTYTPKVIPMYEYKTQSSNSTFVEFFENLRKRFK
jgi:hypothetical protein